MVVCIPVSEDRGLSSSLAAVFEEAEAYLLVDTRTGRYETVLNDTRYHPPYRQALTALAGHYVSGIVVSRMGEASQKRALASRIPVFYAARSTARQVIESLRRGELGLWGAAPSLSRTPRCEEVVS